MNESLPGATRTSESPRQSTVVFLGAGASVDAGIPNLAAMTDRFLKFVDEHHPDLKMLLGKLVEGFRQQPHAQSSVDVESLLRSVDILITAPMNLPAGFYQQEHSHTAEELVRLRSALQGFIRESVISEGDVDYLRPLLDQFFGRPVRIFSVNYDNCIELLCGRVQRRLADGFTPLWDRAALSQGPESDNAVHLYKLHGSAFLYRTPNGTLIKVPVHPKSLKMAGDGSLVLSGGERALPVLAYPGSKAPIEAPHREYESRLVEALSKANLLLVIGYSFRDDHISALVRDALNSNSNLHVAILATSPLFLDQS